VSKTAAPGTFASGVQIVREALPVVMSDLVKHAPENQREKIAKLLDIWERGQTFPPDMLASMKQLLNGKTSSKLSAPLPGHACLMHKIADAHTAPAGLPQSNGTQQIHNAPTNQQSIATPTVAPLQPQQDSAALFAALAGLGQQNGQTNGVPTAPPATAFSQNMVPPPPPGFLPPPPPGANGQTGLPPPPAGANDMTNKILQAMSAGLIAPEQAIQVLNAMAASQNGGANMPSMPPPVAAQAPPQVQPAQQNDVQHDRYEQTASRYRDRSRSPDYERRRSPPRRSPPNTNRRESPVYGVYDPNAGPEGNNVNRSERGERGRGRGKQRGGRNDRTEYRQRSPPRRQSSPPRNAYGNARIPKVVEWDDTLPRDHIRVLSRTLFVGGAGGTEGEIREIFGRFGIVQTCIVNLEKRHAFVKMLTRVDAVSAKQGMDNLQDPSAQSKARQVCILFAYT
jgi:protein NRD1